MSWYGDIDVNQKRTLWSCFAGWAIDAADTQMFGGTPVTSFGIYVFDIDVSGLAGKDLLDVALSGVPEGTFVVAYGDDGKHQYSTPFTEAGLRDSPPPAVPEPGTLAIFGASLLALGLVRRRFC